MKEWNYVLDAKLWILFVPSPCMRIKNSNVFPEHGALAFVEDMFAFFMIWDPIRSNLLSLKLVSCDLRLSSRILNLPTSSERFLFELVSWCTDPSLLVLKPHCSQRKRSCTRTGCARSSPNTTSDSVGLWASQLFKTLRNYISQFVKEKILFVQSYLINV